MATSGDVTFAQDGNARIQQYLVALVRWCVSCLWSTASVLLHRLMTAPLPSITAAKHSKPVRAASREHLHPEPRVECVVLHTPQQHTMDVIFVHGLYGSLGNTWKQGEWRTKYAVQPEKVLLRSPTPNPCSCRQCTQTDKTKNIDNNRNIENNSDNNNVKINYNNGNNKFNSEDNYSFNRNYEFRNIDEKFYTKFKNISIKDQDLITEKFYNNTLLDSVEIVDNYDTQAQFVSDLFKYENDETNNSDMRTRNTCNNNNSRDCGKNESGQSEFSCACKGREKQCDVGCGCICDECYSTCWPRDWIQVDYPGARVLSINYTSDPHLWRPLWIKENKRLRLQERAEQMIEQLLELRVGEKPIIWVGHSKGGLFIKQIYCEAYEAYLNLNNKTEKYTKDILNKHIENIRRTHVENCENNSRNMKQYEYSISNSQNTENNCKNMNNETNRDSCECDIENRHDFCFHCQNKENNSQNKDNNCEYTMNNCGIHCRDFEEVKNKHRCGKDRGIELQSSNKEEVARSRLWTNSVGFMFYSVPHRGSPLADIKTPITARSVELLEISKDCALVLSLQSRWLRAAEGPRPAVRSLVETRRTLMSVLWLRIVSYESADPGIGALCGVSVDHREICKPSSRQCLLYTELNNLIKTALDKCQCT